MSGMDRLPGSAGPCRVLLAGRVAIFVGIAALLWACASVDAQAQTSPKGAPRSVTPKGPAPKAKAGPLRAGFHLPGTNEARFVPTEVILDIPANVPVPTLDAIAARHTMTR